MAIKTKLNAELIEEITSKIRQGSFVHVAAEASGIPRSTFYFWLEKGREAKSGLHKALLDNVCLARAEARHNAERRVFADKPYEWLRTGPGRGEPDGPGWCNDPALIQIDNSVSHEHYDHEQITCPVDAETLAKALQTFEDLGFFRRTPKGALLFGDKNGHAAEEDIVEAMFDDSEK